MKKTRAAIWLLGAECDGAYAYNWGMGAYREFQGVTIGL